MKGRTVKEWSEKDPVIPLDPKLGSRLKPEIKKTIGRHIPEQTGNPNFVEDHRRADIARILMELAREYNPK